MTTSDEFARLLAAYKMKPKCLMNHLGYSVIQIKVKQDKTKTKCVENIFNIKI